MNLTMISSELLNYLESDRLWNFMIFRFGLRELSAKAEV